MEPEAIAIIQKEMSNLQKTFFVKKLDCVKDEKWRVVKKEKKDAVKEKKVASR